VSNTIHILLISGSTRGASTNTATLRTAEVVAPDGVSARLFGAMMDLPYFNPDEDPAGAAPGEVRLPYPAVVTLRVAIAASHAVLFCTPEYAGALPGSFKNLLDWCVGGGEMSRKPAAWINVSSMPTGAADAHASLAKVLGYLDADVVSAACVRLPVGRSAVGGTGLIADAAIRAGIADVLATLAAHCRGRDGESPRLE